jgi:hypothetical protein
LAALVQKRRGPSHRGPNRRPIPGIGRTIGWRSKRRRAGMPARLDGSILRSPDAGAFQIARSPDRAMQAVSLTS